MQRPSNTDTLHLKPQTLKCNSETPMQDPSRHPGGSMARTRCACTWSTRPWCTRRRCASARTASSASSRTSSCPGVPPPHGSGFSGYAICVLGSASARRSLARALCSCMRVLQGLRTQMHFLFGQQFVLYLECPAWSSMGGTPCNPRCSCGPGRWPYSRPSPLLVMELLACMQA